jgi:hypothetical protein
MGVIYGASNKQKLNTQRSTESELVGTDDVMPQILWTLYFLGAQGYKIDENILYQDKKSSILLETNGRGSSGKRTRHIAVRYFFIADRVKSKEIRIEYCPTGIMIADYFTKPLQGAIFRKLRAMIMGNDDIALPSDQLTAQSNGIPPAIKHEESRSVLKDEKVTGSSLFPLTVLPSHRRVIGPPRCSDGITTRIPSNEVLSKPSQPSVSWADIARK